MSDPSATGNTAPANELHVGPQGSLFVRQIPRRGPAARPDARRPK